MGPQEVWVFYLTQKFLYPEENSNIHENCAIEYDVKHKCGHVTSLIPSVHAVLLPRIKLLHTLASTWP